MDFGLAAIASAIWLGTLTSISPCPLATNILAITFISKKLTNPFAVLTSGFLYAAGRMAAYTALGFIILYSISSVASVSMFVQNYMNKILGPLLIIAGMFLLEMISFVPKGSFASRISSKIDVSKPWSSFVLGFIFALSFCPVSAALFFGSLVPIALKARSAVLLPSIYGFGTALPVLAVSVPIVLGMKRTGELLSRIDLFERWARRITGIAFIVVGIYFILAEIFRIF